jgi:hypothetical protein
MNAMDVSLRSRGNLGRWFGYLVLAYFAIISLFPIWIAVKTALRIPLYSIFSGYSVS